MKDALNVFSRHHNIRTFIYDILNGTITPFIQLLSEMNNKDPHLTALDLSTRINDYLETLYRLSKYFNIQTDSSMGDYLHNNERSSAMAFEYLLASLANSHSKEQMYVLLYSILSPYMAETKSNGE